MKAELSYLDSREAEVDAEEYEDGGAIPPELQTVGSTPIDPVSGVSPVEGLVEVDDRMYGKLVGEGNTSIPKVIKHLMKALEASGPKGTPIRIGVGRHKVRGLFKIRPEVIRLARANTLPTATHEVAHALEKAVFGWTKGGPWKGKLITALQQAELVKLGKDLYGDRKPNGGYKREGWAEFVRLWVTSPETVQKAAPRFHEWFEQRFLAEHKEIAKWLRKARKSATEWRMQGSSNRARQDIVDTLSPAARFGRAARALTPANLKKAWVESGEIFFAMERLAKERGITLDPTESPEWLFTTFQTRHAARTRYMVEEGMIDLAGTKVGPALKDAAALVKGKQKDFAIFLYAKRALALHNEGRGREPRLSKTDAAQIIQELGSDKFNLAAQKFYDWQDGVLSYIAQASPTLAEMVAQIRKRDPGSYIPLQREFDEALELVEGERRPGGIIQRLRGSGRRIKDPFQQIIGNTATRMLLAHKRAVMEATFALSKRVPGIGKFVERIPVEMEKKYEASVEELSERLWKEHGLMTISPETAEAEGVTPEQREFTDG
ncbi:MAG TPA: hypothetical protein VF653_06535, partial [Methylomirabilota bacterium]